MNRYDQSVFLRRCDCGDAMMEQGKFFVECGDHLRDLCDRLWCPICKDRETAARTTEPIDT
ncbi:MAG: hypothetical protein MUO26_07930 [Methanotrichaceae archaeon]|nr:hypothetical protein [Methanotrichaceae archaeon]